MQMTRFLVRNVPADGRLCKGACADPPGEVVYSALRRLESTQVGARSSSKVTHENSRLLPGSTDPSLPPVMGSARLAATSKTCFIPEHPSCFSR